MSTMKRAIVSLVLLAGLTVPSIASASAPATWQRKALALSEHVFHPSCGPLSLVFEDASQAHAGLPAGNDPAAGQSVANPTGWARSGQCIIHLNRDHAWLGYPEFCRVVLHEAGNVVGYSDDFSNPNSIRYPTPFITKTTARINGHMVTRWTGVDRRCLS